MTAPFWVYRIQVIIKEKCETMKDKELAEHLGKLLGTKIGIDTVRKQRRKLGLKKQPGRGISKLKD